MDKHEIAAVCESIGRRHVLRAFAGALGGAALSACGGGGGGVTESKTSVVAPIESLPTPSAQDATNPTVVTASPPVIPNNELRVSLPSGSATNYPLQFGRAFAQGAVTGEPFVALDGQLLSQQQVDIKTRYEDGSVKFAVISVIIPTLTTREIVLAIGNRAAGPTRNPESVSNMLSSRYGFEATIGIAVGGQQVPGAPVSARAMLSTLTDSALAAETAAGGVNSRYWTVGPVCTTVLLCDHTTKAWDIGTNATKAIRPMFHVQFWPSIGKYHVRHILEISDATKLKEETALDVSFTTGFAAPSVRLSQSGVNLFMGSFASRSYWGGAALPRANVKHNLPYLSEVGVVPNFDPSITINAASLASYASDWAARAKGLGDPGYWEKAMAATGGRSDLGIMPKWDVLALYTGAAHMHEIAEAHAELAGWWNMHYREGSASKTIVPGTAGNGRVLSKMLGGRPTFSWAASIPSPGDGFTVDGSQTSRDGWGADTAHTPGLYWFQYLTTGSAFWHEKLLQIASFSLFAVNPGASFNSVGNGRNSTDLVLNGVQLRAYGWQMRNRARAWWASLDASPEGTLFTQAMEDGLAQRAGLYDVPGMMVGNPIRDAWNTNHMQWWSSTLGGVVTNPRPNAMGWGEPGGYLAGSNGFPLPTDGHSSTAMWMHNYNVVSLAHAAELGYEAARPLAEWFARSVVSIANSAEPRHVGDYIIPNTKLDGTLYQSPESIWATYAHNADGVEPTDVPQAATSGFSAGGTPNTLSVRVEGYGSISAAAIAMVSGSTGADSAWAVVEPWHSSTVYYNHDPRWAILPRT